MERRAEKSRGNSLFSYATIIVWKKDLPPFGLLISITEFTY